MTQVLHFDMATASEDPLQEEFRKNLGKIITARTYEIYEDGCRQFGTTDLVVMINATGPEDTVEQALVFTRDNLLKDTTFPANLRERVSGPARIKGLSFDTQTFWAIVLWRKQVAALAVGFQMMSPGGSA